MKRKKIAALLMALAMVMSSVPEMTFAAAGPIEITHVGAKVNSTATCSLAKDGTLTISGSGYVGTEFQGDNNVKSIVFAAGSNVTEIKSEAFKNCKNLESITLPDTITTLGAYVFAKTPLQSITIPKSVITMRDNVGGYHGALCDSSITTVVFGEGMKDIPDFACQGATKLTSVTIPSTVENLGEYSFKECSELTSVSLPKAIKSIGSYSFAESNLTALEIPEGVTYLGAYMLSKNTGVTAITIPKSVETALDNEGGNHGALCESGVTKVVFEDGITTLPAMVCHGATLLTDVTIPDSVTKISDEAFRGCSALAKITLPKKLEYLGSNTFEGTALTALEIPEGVTFLGAYILKDNTGVKTVTVPKSVVTMMDNVGGNHGTFYGSGVTSVVFEDGIETIPHKACQGAKLLESVIVPGSVTSIESYAFADTGLTSLTLPEGLTTMGAYLFADGTPLKELFIPKSVERMYDNEGGYHGALCDSALEKVTFEKGIEKLYDYALDGTKSLKETEIPLSVEALGENAFRNVASGFTIYCYSNSYISSYADTQLYKWTAIDEAKINEITASDITRYSADKIQKFALGATNEGDTPFIYSTDSQYVQVDEDGTVRVAKDFIGTAHITIKTVCVEPYRANQKTITIKVLPGKSTVSSASNVKGKKIIVKWKKAAKATGYQLQWSTNSKFKSGNKSVTTKNTSRTISGLKKGKTYYVRVRAYNVSSGKKVYSSWSATKKIKVNK